MFSLGGIKALSVLLGGALLSLAWWHGYMQGADRATERGEAKISQRREAFADQERQRAEQEAQTLKVLQQRFAHHVRLAHQAEQDHLINIKQLRTKTQQLTKRIDDVIHDFLDEKGQARAVACVFTRGFVQHYNAALGMPDANTSGAAAAAGGAGATSWPSETTGTWLRDSGMSQRDILAKIIDNAKQCRVWRSQINGLLDEREGSVQ